MPSERILGNYQINVKNLFRDGKRILWCLFFLILFRYACARIYFGEMRFEIPCRIPCSNFHKIIVDVHTVEICMAWPCRGRVNKKKAPQRFGLIGFPCSTVIQRTIEYLQTFRPNVTFSRFSYTSGFFDSLRKAIERIRPPFLWIPIS